MSHLTLPLPGCQVEGAESMGEWEPVKVDCAVWQDPPAPEREEEVFKGGVEDGPCTLLYPVSLLSGC